MKKLSLAKPDRYSHVMCLIFQICTQIMNGSPRNYVYFEYLLNTIYIKRNVFTK